MHKVKITTAVIELLFVPLAVLAASSDVINLGHRRFHASGKGDITTTGSIADGTTALSVAKRVTWRVGHGIRVRRAGDDALVHAADVGWTLPP